MLEQLSELIGKENILTNEPMSKHTSFHIGGPAGYYIQVRTKEQLIGVLRILQDKGSPYYLIGNGSNLLVGDEGYDGVIVRLTGELASILGPDEAGYITAGAGAMLSQVAYQAMESGFSGMEFAFGIPGTIGGAIVMNAGAYDGEMRLVVSSVRLLLPDLSEVEKSCEAMELGYRTSILKSKAYEGAIVLSVTLQLQQGNRTAIKVKMDEFSKLRQSKQPLEYPSAGSTFKRPNGHYAGKLIMDAGLQGYRIGDAQVSEKHCGFVINRGNATAAEVRALMQQVEDEVFETTGIELEPEVIFLGNF